VLNLYHNLGSAFFVLVTGITLSYLIMFLAFIKNNHVQYFAKYGDFSYGLYIWAFPVQQMLVLRFKDMDSYSNFFIATGVTLILAILSWHLVEKKALRLKPKKQPTLIAQDTNPYLLTVNEPSLVSEVKKG
jgi:peptidoglycan/LPS O-acetylase OafA/YrhL